jgi:hypothetical protein
MSGFISFLFALLFTVALTLTIVFRQEKKWKLARIFGIISVICGAITIVAGAIYYLSPAQPVIQMIGPPEKPYMFVTESRMDELIADKSPVVIMEIQNGPNESTLIFTDVSCTFTRFVPEKYLTYTKGRDSQKMKFAPHQVLTAKWDRKVDVLTQDQINELNAKQPTAELYFFARGEYTDDTGKHPLNLCWKYDKDFPTHLAICVDDITIR